MRRFKIPHKFKLITIIELYAQWIREGKLNVNSDWNKEIGAKFTIQDPCNIGRKSGSNKIVDDLRFVIKTVVGEENFIDTVPSRGNNYCCGGGGGALQAGFPDARRAYGRTKFNQLKATGATYVIAPCHNCHGQVEDIGEQFGGGWHVVHLWTIICLAMGMLSETERTYLGPDLAEVGL